MITSEEWRDRGKDVSDVGMDKRRLDNIFDRCNYIRKMDVWMERNTNEGMDGWMDRIRKCYLIPWSLYQKIGWLDGWWMDGLWVDGWTDGWMDR